MPGKSGWILAIAVVCLAWIAWVASRGAPGPLAVEPSPQGAPARTGVGVEESLTAPALDSRAPAEAPDPVTETAAPRTAQAFPPAPASEVGTLELRIHWERDGAPAGGVGGHLMPWGANDAFLVRRELLTDADGRCSVDQLAPGKVGIYLDRGGGGTAVVEAERVTTHDIALADGVTARGRVLDSAGAPVAGASVALSKHGNTGEGRGVVRSGAAGRYEVRGITSQAAISARAAGHAPSVQVHIEAAAGSVIEIDLRLRGPGGALRGVVLTEDGLALTGARVRIDPPQRAREADDEGRWVESRSLPVELRTGDDGRFHVTGLDPGVHAVRVRSGTSPPSPRTYR